MIGRDHVHYAGHMVGRTDKTRQHLLERQTRGLLLVAHVDEYLSSQVGHEKKKAGRRKTTRSHFFERWNVCQGQLDDGVRAGCTVYGVKHCRNCDLFWNRDYSAASNMYLIVRNELDNGKGSSHYHGIERLNMCHSCSFFYWRRHRQQKSGLQGAFFLLTCFRWDAASLRPCPVRR